MGEAEEQALSASEGGFCSDVKMLPFASVIESSHENRGEHRGWMGMMVCLEICDIC